MNAVTVSMSAVPKLVERHSVRTMRDVARGAKAAARYSKGHLARVTPKDRGGAQHGWVVLAGDGAKMLAEVMNRAPHAGILELGARPHAVSAEGRFSIYLWVERHFRLSASGALQQRVSVETRMLEGVRLTNARSRAFKFARSREKLTAAGSFTRKLIQEAHPEYASRLLPEALNVVGAICEKIKKHGAKPNYFVRSALPHLTEVCQLEVERCMRESAGGAA